MVDRLQHCFSTYAWWI